MRARNLAGLLAVAGAAAVCFGAATETASGPRASAPRAARATAPALANAELVVHLLSVPGALPTSITARASSTPSAGQKPVPSVTTVCPVTRGVARCLLPAGRLDVRLGVPGHLPAFLWGVRLAAGASTRVAPYRLEPGSGVAGRVEGALSAVAIRLRLDRTTTRAGTETGRAFHQTRADARGFFQFRGIEPGSYSLRARADELTAELAITVSTDFLELGEPLLLLPPLHLSIRVEPALTPWGERWDWVLRRPPHCPPPRAPAPTGGWA